MTSHDAPDVDTNVDTDSDRSSSVEGPSVDHALADSAVRSGSIVRLHRRLLDTLPERSNADGADQSHASYKALVVLIATPLLLSLLWHYGRIPYFREAIAPALADDHPQHVVDLWGYWFLAASSIVTRLLIPLAIIVLLFRERPSRYGFKLRGTRKLGFIYLALLAIMLPVLWYASSLPEFQAKYPLYDYASTSLGVFVVYELSYVLVFLSGEAFWRGFMVFGLAPRIGLYALPIMATPYAMIHFGKPFPEALGAILTGLVLGYLALRHGSFWLGVALHSTIGITMDLMCLYRTGELAVLLAV